MKPLATSNSAMPVGLSILPVPQGVYSLRPLPAARAAPTRFQGGAPTQGLSPRQCRISHLSARPPAVCELALNTNAATRSTSSVLAAVALVDVLFMWWMTAVCALGCGPMAQSRVMMAWVAFWSGAPLALAPPPQAPMGANSQTGSYDQVSIDRG